MRMLDWSAFRTSGYFMMHTTSGPALAIMIADTHQAFKQTLIAQIQIISPFNQGLTLKKKKKKRLSV